MSVIQVQNLNKSYNNLQALTEISFELYKGEIFGIIGPDGAGKSTLFNILATLLAPNSGYVSILGMDLNKDYKKIRKEIGYLPGTFSLYPDLTVLENLKFFAAMYQSGIKENLAMIMPIWRQLIPFKNRLAGKLSGGMKQKLALCCALVHKPHILLLDEPTTGVDPVSRREFWELLAQIKSYGISVLVSTPYMDEVTRCDRIALLEKGRFIVIDTPSQIIKDYEGKLYALKTDELFHLLELLDQYGENCSFYPYGEYLHISFYQDVGQAVDRFKNFLNQNQISYNSFQEITPILEDCFIELIKKSRDVYH